MLNGGPRRIKTNDQQIKGPAFNQVFPYQLLTVYGRGCVKTIFLFLSVGNRLTKSSFSQWFTNLAHLLAKNSNKLVVFYHSDI
jgi:hypothetical protein